MILQNIHMVHNLLRQVVSCQPRLKSRRRPVRLMGTPPPRSPLALRSGRAVLAGLAVLLLFGLLAPAALAQDGPQLEWDRYDNLVTIERDGRVIVREQQELEIVSGTVRRMTRSFETGQFGRATDFEVSEDGQPYRESRDGSPGTFEAADNGSEAEILLFFRDAADTRHDLTIEYTLERSLVDNGSTATLSWDFFWSGRAPPIRDGSVQITFPESIAESQLNVDVEGPQVSGSFDGSTVRLELDETIQSQQLGVTASFPRQILASSAQLRSGSTSVPATGTPQPQPSGGISSFGFVLLCLLVLVVFFFIVNSARRREGGYSEVPAYGPDDDQYGPTPWPPTLGLPRRRRRRYGSGWGMPPVIVVPGGGRRDDDRPFSEGWSPNDSDSGSSGGGLGDWFGGGGSSSTGGGFGSWGSSSGGSRSWGGSGGGSGSWGGGGGGGGSRGGGGGGGFG